MTQLEGRRSQEEHAVKDAREWPAQEIGVLLGFRRGEETREARFAVLQVMCLVENEERELDLHLAHAPSPDLLNGRLECPAYASKALLDVPPRSQGQVGECLDQGCDVDPRKDAQQSIGYRIVPGIDKCPPKRGSPVTRVLLEERFDEVLVLEVVRPGQ